MSENHSCRLVGISRSVTRYIPRTQIGEAELRERIRTLARQNKRYGCPRITEQLRREGMKVNHKRVHRIWKDEGLALPRRRPARRRVGPVGEIFMKAQHENHVWCYDFVEDRTEHGDALRMLCVLDEYTRMCHEIRVERSFGADKVIDTLNWLFLTRGVPGHIRSDNGPEFAANAVRKWLERTDCKTIFIEPGSPWENCYIESFNGKLRDECLNRELFRNIGEARQVVENWRRHYNERRPHSSLGYLTPAEYAAHSGSSTPFRFPLNDNAKDKTKNLIF